MATTLDPRLIRMLEALDARSVSFAAAWRLVGGRADSLGISRPTYWQVRRFVEDLRQRQALARVERERRMREVVVPLLTARAPRIR